jgi:predicted CopG family antitoxin
MRLIKMKKLTISIDDDVYAGLYATIGRGNISSFLNNVARAHVIEDEIKSGYEAMAADKERENDALTWAENSVWDHNHG